MVCKTLSEGLDPKRPTVAILDYQGEFGDKLSTYAQSCITPELELEFNVLRFKVAPSSTNAGQSENSRLSSVLLESTLPHLGFVDLFLTNHPYLALFVRPENKICYIGHTSFYFPSANGFAYADQLKFCDFVCVPSRGSLREMVEGFKLYATSGLKEAESTMVLPIQGCMALRPHGHVPSIIPLGSLKFENNPVVSKQFSKQIWIVPTHSGSLPVGAGFFSGGKEIIQALLLHFPEYEVILRPYPGDSYADAVIVTELQSISHKNFVLDRVSGSTHRMYDDAAVFITDGSTGAFSYANKKKRMPIFVLPKTVQMELYGRWERFVEDCESVGLVAQDAEGVVQAVWEILHGVKDAEKRIDAFFDREMFNPGQAPKALVREIHSMLQKEMEPRWTATEPC
jgi:hypothetical protein